jgi:erythronate-4-phosphate dehydrogenase
MVRLLVDSALLDSSGQATGSLPMSWLDGFDLVPYPPRALTADLPGARTADAVLLRTVTRLPRALVEELPQLRAVATISSGTDHIDVEALQDAGVALHTGHGGNAHAVADWVHWALDTLDRPLGRASWAGRRVLLVGAGAVGTAVATRLQALGATAVLCDPPRAERQPGFRSVDLDEALNSGPWHAVSLHVPLTDVGRHATRNLLNAERLGRCVGAIVVNAARGGVLDESAAVALRLAGGLRGLALDTFVGEPRPAAEVIAACDLATPHIGGHSIEGKLRVAWRALAGLRGQFGLPVPGPLATAVAEMVASLPKALDLSPFAQLLQADRELRRVSAAGQAFDAVRHGHRRLERAGP